MDTNRLGQLVNESIQGDLSVESEQCESRQSRTRSITDSVKRSLSWVSHLSLNQLKSFSSLNSLNAEKDMSDLASLDKFDEPLPHRCSSNQSHQRQGGSSSLNFFSNAIAYAVSQKSGVKDQDRFDIRLEGENMTEIVYVGVFDGHGSSARAADMCAEYLFDNLMLASKFVADDDESIFYADSFNNASGLIFHDDAIAQAYKNIDVAVKNERSTYPRTGACALTLLIDMKGSADGYTGEFLCKVAWVGDCRAIRILDDGSFITLTEDHRVSSNSSERNRILDSDHTPSEELVNSKSWKEFVQHCTSVDGGAEPRASSFIAHRCVGDSSTGPLCVFSHTGGVSLQVTRSIGDPFAARSIISEPEILTFSIPEDKFSRFILGSDGVFEHVKEKALVKRAWQYSSCSAAAKELVSYCKRKCSRVGGRMDDITCIVLDVNPHLMQKYS